jgi:hypothetical protein
LLHLLLQHTSASLTLNENCDPTVRHDMEQHFLRAVPDNARTSMIMKARTICLRISNLRCWACRYAAGRHGRVSLGLAGDLAGRASHSRRFAKIIATLQGE